jgi:hypothetical protein
VEQVHRALGRRYGTAATKDVAGNPHVPVLELLARRGRRATRER